MNDIDNKLEILFTQTIPEMYGLDYGNEFLKQLEDDNEAT